MTDEKHEPISHAQKLQPIYQQKGMLSEHVNQAVVEIKVMYPDGYVETFRAPDAHLRMDLRKSGTNQKEVEPKWEISLHLTLPTDYEKIKGGMIL